MSCVGIVCREMAVANLHLVWRGRMKGLGRMIYAMVQASRSIPMETFMKAVGRKTRYVWAMCVLKCVCVYVCCVCVCVKVCMLCVCVL